MNLQDDGRNEGGAWRPALAEPALTHSERETADVGVRLARTLRAGDAILLHGDLGAGKTAFVKGLAEGLGVAADEVSSPTFTLIQEYRGGRLTLYHIDLYRLAPREVDDLGLDDLAEQGGVMAIEWPERWVTPPDEAIHVQLTTTGDAEREISIHSPKSTEPDQSAGV